MSQCCSMLIVLHARYLVRELHYSTCDVLYMLGLNGRDDYK